MAITTYTLLDRLNVFFAHSDPPRASQVPCSLFLQILNHDRTQNHHLRVNLIEYPLVAQVQPIGDLLA